MPDFDQGGAEFRLDTSQAEAALERLGLTGSRSVEQIDQRIAAIEQRLNSMGSTTSQGFGRVAQGAQQAGSAINNSLGQAANGPAQLLDKRIEKLTREFLTATTAVTRLQKATLGINTGPLGDAQRIAANYKLQLAGATQQAKQLGLATANVARAASALQSAGTGLTSTFGNIVLGINAMGFTLFAFEQTVRSLSRPFIALKEALIDTNVQFQQSELAIAAVFNNINLESFSQSMDRAKGFVKDLREEAVKTNLTFEELQQAASVGLSPLLRSGLSTQQALKAISLVASASKIAKPETFSAQRLSDEFTAIQNKSVRATSESLKFLGITSQDLRNAKDGAAIYELLIERSQGVIQANLEMQKQFTGASDRLKENFTILKKEVGEPIFKVVEESLVSFANSMSGPEFKNFVQDLVDITSALAQVLRAVIAVTKAVSGMVGAFERFNQDRIQPVLDATINPVAKFFKDSQKRQEKQFGFFIPNFLTDPIVRLGEARENSNRANRAERFRQRDAIEELNRNIPLAPPRVKPGQTEEEIRERKRLQKEKERIEQEDVAFAKQAQQKRDQIRKEELDRERIFIKGRGQNQFALIEIAERGNKELAAQLKQFGSDGFFPPSVEIALKSERDAVEELIKAYTDGLNAIKDAAKQATDVLSVFAQDGIGAAKVELEAIVKQQGAVLSFLSSTGKKLPELKTDLNSMRDVLDSLAKRVQDSNIATSFAREFDIMQDPIKTGKRFRTASGGRSAAFQPLVDAASQRHGIPSSVINALIRQESGFNPRAVSPKGAMGLLQLMPGTAASLGVTNPFSPAQNIDGGVRYLKQQIQRYGSLPYALAAYNGGPGAVDFFKKRGGIFHNPNAPRDSWANQTGGYVRSIIGSLPRSSMRGQTTIQPDQAQLAFSTSKAAQEMEHLGNVASDAMGLASQRTTDLENRIQKLQLSEEEAQRLVIQLSGEEVKARARVIEETEKAKQASDNLKKSIQELKENFQLTEQEKALAAIGREGRQAAIDIAPLQESAKFIKDAIDKGGIDTEAGFLKLDPEILGQYTRDLESLQLQIEKIQTESAGRQIENLQGLLDSTFGLIDQKKQLLDLEDGFLDPEELGRARVELNSIGEALATVFSQLEAGSKIRINGQDLTVTPEFLAKQAQQAAQFRNSGRNAIQGVAQSRLSAQGDAQSLLGLQRNFLTPRQFGNAQTGLNNQQIQQLQDTLAAGGLSREVTRQHQNMIEQLKSQNRDIALDFMNTVIDPIQAGFDSLFDSILEGEVDFSKTFLDVFKNIVRGLERMLSEEIFGMLRQKMLGKSGQGSGILNLGTNLLGGPTGITNGPPPVPTQAAEPSPVAQLQQVKGVVAGIAQGIDQSQLSGSVNNIAGAIGALGRFQNFNPSLGPTSGTGTPIPSGGVAGGLGGLGKSTGLLLLAGIGLGQITAASRAADETGRNRALQGGLGGLVGGASLGALLGPQFGLSAGAGAGLGALGGGLFGVTQGFPAHSAIRQVGGGAISGALSGGMIGNMLFPGVGAFVGAGIGAVAGGIMGLFNLGKARKEKRQAERNAYQDNVLAPFLNNLVSSADPNDVEDLRTRIVQASRGMKARGSRGMAMKSAAQQQLKDLLKEAEKRADEIRKAFDEAIADAARPEQLRGITTDMQQTFKELKEALKLGIEPEKVFKVFNLRIEDQVRELQDQLNGLNEQLIHGEENEKGELISLQAALQERIAKIQEQGRRDLENLRENVAGSASSIIAEGRASAIIPSAASRQQRLSSLFVKAQRDDNKIRTDITNAILKDQNETSRELLEIQTQAKKTQDSILFLLEKAIELAPDALKKETSKTTQPVFPVDELQRLLNFVKNNQFGTLTIPANALGGLPGVTIENLSISNDITNEQLGALIRAEIARREQAVTNQRLIQLSGT